MRPGDNKSKVQIFFTFHIKNLDFFLWRLMYNYKTENYSETFMQLTFMESIKIEGAMTDLYLNSIDVQELFLHLIIKRIAALTTFLIQKIVNW